MLCRSFASSKLKVLYRPLVFRTVSGVSELSIGRRSYNRAQTEARYRENRDKFLCRSRMEGKDELNKWNPSIVRYMSHLKRCGSVEQALEIVEEMKANKVELDVGVWNLVMNQAARAQNLPQCQEIFELILISGLRPNMITLSTLLKAALRNKDLGYALKSWHQLREKNVEPNLICFNNLISCCSELPHLWCSNTFPSERVDLVEKIFQDMLAQKLTPDLVTFNAIINVLAKAGRWERAFEIVEVEMPFYEVEPDVISIMGLVCACNTAGEFERAVDRFEQARSVWKVEALLWTAGMTAYKELGHHTDVRILWDELGAHGLTNQVAVDVFALSLARQGLVEELSLNGLIQPRWLDEIGWKGVINEFYKIGDMKAAMWCFQEAYDQDKISVWCRDEKDTLDLHGQSVAVACCAVQFALTSRTRQSRDAELGIVVGRDLHSSSTHGSIGIKVREFLNEKVGVRFFESDIGGKLIISCEEMRRYTTSNKS